MLRKKLLRIAKVGASCLIGLKLKKMFGSAEAFHKILKLRSSLTNNSDSIFSQRRAYTVGPNGGTTFFDPSIQNGHP